METLVVPDNSTFSIKEINNELQKDGKKRFFDWLCSCHSNRYLTSKAFAASTLAEAATPVSFSVSAYLLCQGFFILSAAHKLSAFIRQWKETVFDIVERPPENDHERKDLQKIRGN